MEKTTKQNYTQTNKNNPKTTTDKANNTEVLFKSNFTF